MVKIVKNRGESEEFEDVTLDLTCFNFDYKYLVYNIIKNNVKIHFVELKKVRTFAVTVSTTLPT